MLNYSLVDVYRGTDTINDKYQLSSNNVNIYKFTRFNLRKLNSNWNELTELWIQNVISINEPLAHEKILQLAAKLFEHLW